MRHIDCYPQESVPNLFSIIQCFDDDIQGKLTELSSDLIPAYENYINLIPELHLIRALDLSKEDKDILLDAYGKKPSSISRMFGSMKASLGPQDQGLCPFCNLSEEYELDHYLPRKRYPEFVLFPQNLVPICGRCNGKKSQVVKDKQGRRVIIYPFHDLRDVDIFLICHIHLDSVARTSFTLNRPANLDPASFGLLERHFSRLGLAERFRGRANNALQSLVLNLNGMSPEAIRKSIESMAIELPRSSPKNYWRSALFTGLQAVINEFIQWIASQTGSEEQT